MKALSMNYINIHPSLKSLVADWNAKRVVFSTNNENTFSNLDWILLTKYYFSFCPSEKYNFRLDNHIFPIGIGQGKIQAKEISDNSITWKENIDISFYYKNIHIVEARANYKLIYNPSEVIDKYSHNNKLCSFSYDKTFGHYHSHYKDNKEYSTSDITVKSNYELWLVSQLIDDNLAIITECTKLSGHNLDSTGQDNI